MRTWETNSIKVHTLHPSASMPTLSAVASGVFSHAYIQYPPLRFNVSGAAGFIYDDGNQLVLVICPNKVLSWPVNEKDAPHNKSVTNFMEGPVHFVRFSLDQTILAVQRSGQEFEFINRETGVIFHQRCKLGTDLILGLFWTDSPTCDVVFVTSSGLELYALSYDRTGLTLTEAKRLKVSWYVYTHESRLVLLASGMQCKTLSGYQFSEGGIIRLPKFDVAMATAEVNSKPVLCFQDVRIATMYGRLYCLQVDRIAMELHLYRFYRDVVESQGFLPIYSGHVALSVVDNVLLVHEIDSKVVLLYDLMSDFKVPISAPLTLLLRGVPSYTLSRTVSESGKSPGIPLSEFDQLEHLTTAEGTVYDSGWEFANSNIVLDHTHGLLWKIHLDLEAITASSSEILTLLAFLQRRSANASKAKFLSMEIVRLMIIERQPLPLIARAMDVITSSHAKVVELTNMSDRTPVSESGQGSHATGARYSAIVQGPRESNISGASLSDSFVHTVQMNANRKKAALGDYVDVESSTTGQVQGNLDEDAGNSCNASPEVENISSSSSTAEGIHHNMHRWTSDMSFGKVEREIDILNVLSSHEHSSVLGKVSGRPWQRSFTEIFVTEFGEIKEAVSPSISPEEMEQSIFCAIEKDSVIDSTFLVATIIEYLRSSAAELLSVNDGLHVLLIQLLAEQQQFYELWQLIVGKVVPPSKAVALLLLEVGACDISTRKLGMAMMRQLHGHSAYVEFLLQEGHILEAICGIRQSKVWALPPAVILEASHTLKDTQNMASVLRFFVDSVPDFKKTQDFSFYFYTLRH